MKFKPQKHNVGGMAYDEYGLHYFKQMVFTINCGAHMDQREIWQRLQ